MALKSFRRRMRPVALAPRARLSTSGIDRTSCSWKDAVGPGYVTGVTQGLVQMVSPLDSERYCR